MPEVSAEFTKRLREFIEREVPTALLSLAQDGASVPEAGAAVAAAFRVVADELEKDTRGDR